MRLDRKMCQMEKNAQSFGAIFRVSEKNIKERQNGWKIWRERVNVERPQESVSISVEKIRKECRKIPIRKLQGETVSKDIGSRTSAVYTNVFSHKWIEYWCEKMICMNGWHMTLQCSVKRTCKTVIWLIIINPLHACH